MFSFIRPIGMIKRSHIPVKRLRKIPAPCLYATRSTTGTVNHQFGISHHFLGRLDFIIPVPASLPHSHPPNQRTSFMRNCNPCFTRKHTAIQVRLKIRTHRIPHFFSIFINPSHRIRKHHFHFNIRYRLQNKLNRFKRKIVKSGR